MFNRFCVKYDGKLTTISHEADNENTILMNDDISANTTHLLSHRKCRSTMKCLCKIQGSTLTFCEPHSWDFNFDCNLAELQKLENIKCGEILLTQHF